MERSGIGATTCMCGESGIKVTVWSRVALGPLYAEKSGIGATICGEEGH
jgi:hypothetical protein